jgi:hypothetical protein
LRRIASELDVSLSSVSVWVRDLQRPKQSPSTPVEDQPVQIELEPLRRCSSCRLRLPLSSFNRSGTGYQWWCRECFRKYFKTRGDLHRRQSGAALQRRRARARTYVDEFLEGAACSDCGGTDRAVFEFDHVREKKREVSRLVHDGAPIDRIEEEIAACEVVCANCHRRRTARRANTWRTHPDSIPTRGHPRPEEIRNVLYVRDVLMASRCIDCLEDDLLVLEFDHVGEKHDMVMPMAKRGCSLERVKQEIAQCEVRCANCHRRRTLGVGRELSV